jgi:drug/metabolite transporter (DMT)-like permease
VLCASFTWAIGTVVQKKFPVHAPLPTFTAWLMLVGGVPIYAGMFVFEDVRQLGSVSLWPALALAYNAVFAFAWGHWAWMKLVTSVSVTVFSLSMLIIPVVGVFSGMLFLGERPGWAEYAALALVLASLATVAPRRR